MRLLSIVLFWASLGILFYAYIGYPILLYILVKIRKVSTSQVSELPNDTLPDITFIVAAYNEQAVIEKKIQNSLSLIYPSEKLRMIFVTDGSQDKTVELVSRYPAIKLLHEAERKGKVSAINRAMKEVTTPIVIFSDANSLVNAEAIKKIVRHYQDKMVGGVTGEKKVTDPNKDLNGVLEESSYWKYESFLKKMDSSFYTVVGAAGELFSMRTELFEFLSEQIILEDFVQSLLICQKGYSVKYEPGAVATETSSSSIKEEQKRKVRISAGGFQAIRKLKPLFNVFKYPKVFFQLLSHRILRWTICPICLPCLFITNLILALTGHTFIYKLFFVFQVLFYLFATLGFVFAYNNIKIRLLSLSYYFIFMNAAVYMGFWKFIQNRQTVLWEKATRQDSG